MRSSTLLALPLAAALVALGPAPAPAASVRLAFHEDAVRAVDRVTGQLRELADRLEEHLAQGPGGRGPGPDDGHGRSGRHGRHHGWSGAERPVIGPALAHRDALGLTAEQVTRLQALRDEFGREAIRREADLRIAEMDLQAILQKEPVDLAQAEAKIREAAQVRTDLRVARLRAIEQGKAVLTAEQRARLEGLVRGGPGQPGPRRTGGARGPEAGRTGAPDPAPEPGARM
jgi:Spy/CpxP family protein refolding chaperone